MKKQIAKRLNIKIADIGRLVVRKGSLYFEIDNILHDACLNPKSLTIRKGSIGCGMKKEAELVRN